MDAVPPTVADAARDFASRLRARFGARLLEVRLCGSQARGDAGVDSDVDLYVRVEGLVEAERRAIFELAGEVSIEHLVELQAFAPAPAEHDWLTRHECRILRDVAAEGLPL